jgi:hypothetical protein
MTVEHEPARLYTKAPLALLLRCALAVLAIVLSASACDRPAEPQPVPVRLRFRSGTGAGFSPLGAAIVNAYHRTLPAVEFRGQDNGTGSFQNAQALQQGTADIAFVFSNVAYLSFVGNLEDEPTRFDRLRGIAVLGLTPLQLIVRPGIEVKAVSDLRGRRVATGPPDSDTQLLAALVLRAYDLDPRDIDAEAVAASQAVPRLLAGTMDAAFALAGYPGESFQAAARGGGILIDVAGSPVDRLRLASPFVRPTLVPGGTYSGHPAGILTVGVDNLLVCRADLSEQLVYELTKAFFEALPDIVAEHPRLRLMDIARAPATPIPLHPGAARYYRERELTR